MKIKKLSIINHLSSITNAGFTLIELIVVLAILGILVSLIYINLQSSRGRARDAKRKADLGQIKKALELYRQDNPSSGYPAGDGNAETILDGFLESSYMSDVPDDPLADSGEHYNYLSPRSGIDNYTFRLFACLENTGDPDRDDNDGGGDDLCGDAGEVSYTVREP